MTGIPEWYVSNGTLLLANGGPFAAEFEKPQVIWAFDHWLCGIAQTRLPSNPSRTTRGDRFGGFDAQPYSHRRKNLPLVYKLRLRTSLTCASWLEIVDEVHR